MEPVQAMDDRAPRQDMLVGFPNIAASVLLSVCLTTSPKQINEPSCRPSIAQPYSLTTVDIKTKMWLSTRIPSTP